MKVLNKTLIGAVSSTLALLALTSAPAMAASSFGDHLWQFVSADGTTTANVIDFNKGLSRIFDAGNLTLTTDDTIYLDAPGVVWLNNALSANSVTTRGGATITQNLAVGGNATVGGTTTSTGLITGNGGVASDVTRLTGATGSFQSLSGDLTYQGAAGDTSAYHAGVMGNFHGDTLTNTTSSYHAGVIGSYNVTTSDANTGASAGVIGEVGDAAVANAAVMAVLGGDSIYTANAAYGVQYFNSNADSHFNYGLDLFHAATADYGAPSAVEYGTADIRLQNGETISNSTNGTIDFGSADLLTTGLVNNIRLSDTHVDAKDAGTILHIGELTNQTALGSASSLITASGAVDFSGATSFKVPSGVGQAAGACTSGTIGQIYLATSTVAPMTSGHVYICTGDLNFDGTNNDPAWQTLN